MCTYAFSPFTITGRGEYKTLAEHQADLKREFCKDKGDKDNKGKK